MCEQVTVCPGHICTIFQPAVKCIVALRVVYCSVGLCRATLVLYVYFTPGCRIIFYSYKILTALIVNKLYGLLWFLKFTWLNTRLGCGTGVPKHVAVTSFWLSCYTNSAFCW